jgi:hypothetical protein
VHAADANGGAVEVEVDAPESLWEGRGFALVLLIRGFALTKPDGGKGVFGKGGHRDGDGLFAKE